MSGPVTEIAYLPIQSTTDLTAGDAKAIWDDTLKTISSQPGCKSLFWGRQIEHPDVVQLIIDWESHQHHHDFMSAPIYEPFLKRLGPILAGAPHLLHVRIPTQATPLSGPASAPVTECVSLYFEPGFSETKYNTNWASFVQQATKAADEAQGFSGGWALEEQQHAKLGSEDGQEGPAKLFGAFIGWPTVEAHMKFREHAEFPTIIAPLRDGPKASTMCHVAFQRYH